MDRPLPVTDDHDTAPLFAAATQGEVAVCFCPACDMVAHPPRSICAECYGATDFKTVEATGTLTTYTVVAQQVHPAFPTPYTVVLVELDAAPGVRLVGHMEGAHDLPIGSAMGATFDPVGEVAMVNWRPTVR